MEEGGNAIGACKEGFTRHKPQQGLPHEGRMRCLLPALSRFDGLRFPGLQAWDTGLKTFLGPPNASVSPSTGVVYSSG